MTLFILLFLLVPAIAARVGRPLEGSVKHSVLAAPALLFVFPALIAIEPKCSAPLPVFAALFALMAVIAGFAIARRQGMLHLVAAFFAVVAEAVWSVRYLNEETLLAGLAVYGVFALFYLGVPMLARRLGRPLEPVGGAAALLLVSLALLFFLALGAAAQAALWGLALMLVVLNAGLFLEGAAGRVPILCDRRDRVVVACPGCVVDDGGCVGCIGAGAGRGRRVRRVFGLWCSSGRRPHGSQGFV